MIPQHKQGISVVIMAHERQEETLRAVASLLEVDFGCETEIVVSDNPSTPEKAIKNLPMDVVHRVRNSSGDSLWHANQIFKEIDHEWTLLTHDDDEILPRLGDVFRNYSADPEVMMITGKSRIFVRNIETEDQGYLNRLEKAKLLNAQPTARTDLFEALFDIGPLFPASAMIIRTEFLRTRADINPDFDLAGDLAQSMALAKNAKVIFDGSSFVMNYHIHGGNSVFTSRAAGGLMADFTIVRLSEAVRNSLEITPDRKKMLMKAIIVSRILAKAFHLNHKYSNVNLYTKKFNQTFTQNKINSFILLPIPLGPLKILVRRLMWKRLGVNRWGY